MTSVDAALYVVTTPPAIILVYNKTMGTGRVENVRYSLVPRAKIGVLHAGVQR